MLDGRWVGCSVNLSYYEGPDTTKEMTDEAAAYLLEESILHFGKDCPGLLSGVWGTGSAKFQDHEFDKDRIERIQEVPIILLLTPSGAFDIEKTSSSLNKCHLAYVREALEKLKIRGFRQGWTQLHPAEKCLEKFSPNTDWHLITWKVLE